MYLANIKLWNFRKYGSIGDIDLNRPNLDLSFTKGLNVLIGENDSGKTAILEAIKMVLKTHAYERIMWDDDDFFVGTNEIRIELLIDGLTDQEAAHFTEWLGWNNANPQRPILRLIQKVRRVNGRIIPQDVKAGMDEVGILMESQAREYLKVTFLKPLRDADNELTAKKFSRLSQILEGHELFKDGADGKRALEEYVREANDKIQEWFQNDEAEDAQMSNRAQIKGVIDGFLGHFIEAGSESSFSISGSRIREILEKLSLHLAGSINPGLGTMNRLYIAAELLHLQKMDWTGMRLCLVEEAEAHLHPQAQMKVLDSIQNEHGTQFIITTHSPNLASKVHLYEQDLNQVIICKGARVFPMGANYTLLEKEDYQFLGHFLDVTKSSLFFAKGLIFIEGWAEEILLPAIAKKMGMDFTNNEISMVNVGSTAYMRYAKIFMRKDKERMTCKVAIVTDLDIRPNDQGQFDINEEANALSEITSKINVADYPDLKWCVAKRWTLEWCVFKSFVLRDLFKKAAAMVHSNTFKTDGAIIDDASFEQRLMDKLRGFKITENGEHESVSGLKKVEVANVLALLINEADANIFDKIRDDDSAKYLFEAIGHVCS